MVFRFEGWDNRKFLSHLCNYNFKDMLFRGGEIGAIAGNSFSVMYPKASGSAGLTAHIVVYSTWKLTLKSTKFLLGKLFNCESTFFV